MSRKLLCSLLGAAMVLAVSGSAFADEVDMNEDGTVNNPEAVEVAEGDLSFWSLFTGGDLLYETADRSCHGERSGYRRIPCIKAL